MYPKKMGGFFFFLFPNFVIWRVFPKNTKISQIGSRQKKKKNPIVWVQNMTKFVGEKTTTTRMEKNEKKMKKKRKKVQNLQQQ
jgi:hypothetical protein